MLAHSSVHRHRASMSVGDPRAGPLPRSVPRHRPGPRPRRRCPRCSSPAPILSPRLAHGTQGVPHEWEQRWRGGVVGAVEGLELLRRVVTVGTHRPSLLRVPALHQAVLRIGDEQMPPGFAPHLQGGAPSPGVQQGHGQPGGVQGSNLGGRRWRHPPPSRRQNSPASPCSLPAGGARCIPPGSSPCGPGITSVGLSPAGGLPAVRGLC